MPTSYVSFFIFCSLLTVTWFSKWSEKVLQSQSLEHFDKEKKHLGMDAVGIIAFVIQFPLWGQ